MVIWAKVATHLRNYIATILLTLVDLTFS